MNSRPWRRRVGVMMMVLACGAWRSTLVLAQAPARAPAPGEVASDPIKCWWKTDKNAVQVGERFTLALTCGVIEAGRITVVPDLKQLEPATIQLTPFEVIDGARHEDIQAPPWRYFEYEYVVRLIGEGFFGQDVDIPSINVMYNIQSTSAGIEGRDQMYALPALPIRIASLVPKKATDIQDASRETFGDIEARRFRATGELVAAGIFFGFAVVLVGLAVVRTVGRYRERVPVVARPLPSGTVLGGCLRDIGRLKSDVAREGWTPELAGRALTMFRIAGAVALDRPVAQAVVDMNVPGREGQLVLRTGILRPKRALVSAPTTAEAVARQLGNGNRAGLRTQAMLEEIRDSLRVFNAARYSRNGHLDTTALDTTLEIGTSAIRRLRVTKRWPMRVAAAFAQSAAALRGTVWSR